MPTPPSILPSMIFTTAAFLGLAPILGGLEAVSNPQQSSPTAPIGLIVQPGSNGPATFMEWESSDTIQRAIMELRKAQGGRIQWLPGTYVIPQPIEVWYGKDIQIEGLPGTILTFPPAPKFQATLKEDLVEGEFKIKVNRPEALHLNWQYQLYAADGSGSRLLEFRVTAIDGDTATIHPAIRFMRPGTRIDKGCIVVERVNFLEFHRSQNITVRGLTMDGGSRGSVAGHTTYCGVIAAGPPLKDGRPQSHGIKIQGCTFQNLNGRGVAIYSSTGIVIEDCHFQNIAWQALEIDHYSSGVVTRNLIEDSVTGLALNDAFATRVQFNTFRNCQQSIALFRHVHVDWLNTNHEISFNYFDQKLERPAIKFHHPMTGNRIEHNYFLNMSKELWVQGAGDNHVADNLPVPSK